MRALSHATATTRRESISLADRNSTLHRLGLLWPAEASALLQLAAVAHGLEDALSERLTSAPGRLAAWSSREPWTVESDEARTLRLAVLVCLEQLDYRSFVPVSDIPMVLRDALGDSEDLVTIAAMVRWESLERLEVTTPDRTLETWRRHVLSLERGWEGWDHAEYHNTLDVRGHLQRFVAALTWAGQERWREHLEPVDEAFRACTERQQIPLALTPDARPGGWWRYRLPTGAAAAPGWSTWPIRPTRYVTRAHGRGGLGTISDVWELAERRDGLRAMTDQELGRWAALCARQADAEARHGGSHWWTDHHERVTQERQRRAARTNDRSP